MTSPLDALAVVRKHGAEPFHAAGTPLGPQLAHFWQWMGSDLVTNTMRGLLAEYLVAHALGLAAAGVRVEWDAYDLKTPAGLTIEVKSAAYLQSWRQTRPSPITFSIRPTQGWVAETNTYSTAFARQADIYVFALLIHQDKATLDPLDITQWRFLVLPTSRLNALVPAQKTIGLNSLRKLQPLECEFQDLSATIERCAAEPTPPEGTGAPA